jgi:hypothetical protein
MSESRRAILGFSIVICAFVAFFAWLADFGYPPLVWAARILSPVAFVWIIVALILDLREKDGAPDFIRQQGLSPFERDGFCFAIVPKTVDYFEKRAPAMRYRFFRKQGLYIASGHVEAACRTDVARRCKQAGMHWRRHNAARICAILASLRSFSFAA